MNLSPIATGDIVQVNKRGRVFLAVVGDVMPRTLTIRPLSGSINYFTAEAREVRTHYRKMGRPRQHKVRG